MLRSGTWKESQQTLDKNIVFCCNWRCKTAVQDPFSNQQASVTFSPVEFTQLIRSLPLPDKSLYILQYTRGFKEVAVASYHASPSLFWKKKTITRPSHTEGGSNCGQNVATCGMTSNYSPCPEEGDRRSLFQVFGPPSLYKPKSKESRNACLITWQMLCFSSR